MMKKILMALLLLQSSIQKGIRQKIIQDFQADQQSYVISSEQAQIQLVEHRQLQNQIQIPEIISIGQVYNGQVLLQEDEGYLIQINKYHLKLIKDKEKDDIILITKGKSPTDDPDIYVSFKDQDSANPIDSEFKCTSFGTDICTIPKDKVKDDIYIGIICSRKCSYTLRALYISEKHMTSNDSLSLQFDLQHKNTQSAKIITIKTPSDITQLENLNIQVELSGLFAKQEGFLIFLTEGPKLPTTSNFDVKGVDVFSGVKLIQLHKTKINNQLIFKPSTEYKLLIEAPSMSYVEVKTFTFSSKREIYLFDFIWDVVEANNTKNYILNFKDDRDYADFRNQSLTFTLIPYAGNPGLYINIAKQPLKLKDYKWHTQELGGEQIVISRNELNQSKISKEQEIYYITVHATLASSYTLLVSVKDLDYQRIAFNIPTAGNLIRNEIQNYILALSENHKTKIYIDVTNTVGHVQLYIKQCPSILAFNCALDEEDIGFKYTGIPDEVNTEHNDESYEHFIDVSQYPPLDFSPIDVEDLDDDQELDLVYLFNPDKGTKQISFDYDPKKCNTLSFVSENQQDYTCIYVIGLYAPQISKYTKKLNSYTIVLSHSSNLILLQESIPFESIVQLGQVMYFSFTVPQSETNAYSLQFMINNLQGSTDTFCSRTHEYPNENNKDKETVFNLIEYTKKKDGPMQGTYYLSVKGLTQSEFRITPIIQRTEALIKYIMMEGEQPVKGSISKPGDSLYYQFDTQEPDQQEGYDDNLAVNINLQKIMGEFDAFITTNTIQGAPSEDNYVWILKGETLHIKPKDPNYSQTYYICVQAKNQSNPISGSKTSDLVQQHFEFKLSYQTSNVIQKLQLNEAVFHYIHANQTLNYKVKASLGEEIHITKYGMSDKAQVDVYIGLDQENDKPDIKNNDFVLTKNDQSYNITSETLTLSHCEFLLNSTLHEKCHIYLTVRSNNDTYFSLMASSNTNLYTLYDGIPIQVSLPIEKNQGVNFYYYVPKNKMPIKIYEYNYILPVSIYVKIFKYKDGMSQQSWPFPTPQQYDIIQTQKSYVAVNSIVIQPEALESRGCYGNTTCIMTIAIFTNLEDSPYDLKQLKKETFQLQVSSLITKLQIGKAQVGSLFQNQIVYYQFQNFHNESILISFTSLSYPDAKIFVSKGKQNLPDQINHEWVTQYYNDNEILISFGSVGSVSNTTEGIYNIGVFSSSSIDFSLQVSTGPFKYFHLMHSYPLRVYLDKNQKAFFLYKSYDDNEFKVLLSKLSGNMFITIFSQKEFVSLQDFLQKQAKLPFKSNKKQQNTNLLVVNQTDVVFCDKCNYIVEIFATQASDFSIIIERKGQAIVLENNKILKNSLLFKEEQKYTHFGYLDFNCEIKITQGSLQLYVQNGYDVTTTKFNTTITCKANEKCSYQEKISENGYYTGATFLVVGLNDTQTLYSIQIFGEEFIQQIAFGQPEIFNIQSADTRKFHIFYQNDTQKQGFTVSLQIVDNKFGDAILDYFPNVQIYRDLKKNQNNTGAHDLIMADIVRVEIMNEHAIFDVHESQGMFVIEISNTQLTAIHSNIELELVLTVNQDSLQILIPQVSTLHFTPVGRIQGFELYAPQKSKILVETLQCTGLVSVFATQNLEHLQQGVSELESTRIYSDRQQILFTMQQPGVIYIGVKGISGDFVQGTQTHNSLYIVKAKVYEFSQNIPLDKLLPGDNGRILWEFDGHDFLVSLQKVEILESLNDLFVVSYDYHLSFHNDPSVNKNYCKDNTQIINLSYTAAEHELMSTIQLKTNQQLPNEFNALVIQVGAHVHLQNIQGDKEVVKLYYDTEQIPNYSNLYVKHANRHRRWYIPALFFLSFLALIGVVVYLVRRVRNLSSRLHYELNDVRNMASVDTFKDSSEIEMNYKGLRGETLQQPKLDQL